MASEDPSVVGLSKGRVEALSDGIFATVMTVLVLSLSVPVINGPQVTSELILDLNLLLPNIISYIFSFIFIGAYWIRHHNMFHFIKVVNRTFLWLNMLFLLTIGFIPFSTALIGRYPFVEIPILIYGLNVIVTGLSFQFKWIYLSRSKMLIKDLEERVMNRMNSVMLIGLLIYAAAIMLSFLNNQVSLVIYALMPIFYILVGVRRVRRTVPEHPNQS